jgi:ABC-type polysaccharide/polyol phosphate transport system ATPase subunit
MAEDTVITGKNITKTYKMFRRPGDRVKETFHPFRKKYHFPFNALNDASFQIKRGESVGIIGRNGSGKSTLLQIICGILLPSSGSIRTDGRISAILELGAGFNPEFTGRQNVYLNGAILGLSPKEMEARFAGIVNYAGIKDFIDQPVKTYSSGMYVRLAFAVAINMNPDILVVDEVLAVGDIRFQMKCIKTMERLQQEQKTILFVTHAIELTKRFCSRSLWIEDGEIRMNGPSTAVAEAYLDSVYREGADKTDQENRVKTETPESLSPARIVQAKVIDADQREAASFKKSDDIALIIKYEIFDTAINNILLGVALLDRKNTYIYGPNTYLDNFTIPSHRGTHQIIYKLNRNPLLGGTFFFDVGLYIDKGMVCLDYQAKIANFLIETDYVAEGLCELKHEWILAE